MVKKTTHTEDKKVKSSDFSEYQTGTIRATGLHQIFASFTDKDESRTWDVELESQQNELMLLINKLRKKDTFTKTKALETLSKLIEVTPEMVVEEVMTDFIHIFKRMALVDPMKKVRLEYGLLLSKIALKLKKRMQQHMDVLITHWWIGMNDQSDDISDIYTMAFKNIFVTTEDMGKKTLRILLHYKDRITEDYLKLFLRDMDEYKKDWVDVFGKVCQDNTTILEIYQRLIDGILRSMTKLFILYRSHYEDLKDSMNSGRTDYSSANNALREETEFSSSLLTRNFLRKVTIICKSSDFRLRLSSLRMLVELVKMLKPKERNLVREVFEIGMESIKLNNEVHLTYHNIRLICACIRFDNSLCYELNILKDYTKLLDLILNTFTGDYGNKIDLFMLFPSLLLYLPKKWLSSAEGFNCIFTILKTIANLMEKELEHVNFQSYTFDHSIFKRLGTTLICCYYKILLLLRDTTRVISSDEITETSGNAFVQGSNERVTEENNIQSVGVYISDKVGLSSLFYLPFRLFNGDYPFKYFIVELPSTFVEFVRESHLFDDDSQIQYLLNELERLPCNFITVKMLQLLGDKSTNELYRRMLTKLIHHELPKHLNNYIQNEDTYAGDSLGVESTNPEYEIENILDVLRKGKIDVLDNSELYKLPELFFNGTPDGYGRCISLVDEVYTVILRGMELKDIFAIFNLREPTDVTLFVYSTLLRDGRALYGLNTLLSMEFGSRVELILRFLESLEPYAKDHSNELIQWSLKHLSLPIVSKVLNILNLATLTHKNTIIHTLLTFTTILYSNKDISPMAESEDVPKVVTHIPPAEPSPQLRNFADIRSDILVLYLYIFYNKFVVHFDVFVSFCMDNLYDHWVEGVGDNINTELSGKLAELSDTTSNDNEEDCHLNSRMEFLSSLLYTLNPDISNLMSVLDKVLSLNCNSKDAHISNYTLFMLLWVEHLTFFPHLTGECLISFTDTFARNLLALNSTFNELTSLGALDLFNGLRQKLKHGNECLLSSLTEELMKIGTYSSIDDLNSNLDIYRYFIKTCSTSEIILDISKRLHTHFTTNQFAGYFYNLLPLEHTEAIDFESILREKTVITCTNYVLILQKDSTLKKFNKCVITRDTRDMPRAHEIHTERSASGNIIEENRTNDEIISHEEILTPPTPREGVDLYVFLSLTVESVLGGFVNEWYFIALLDLLSVELKVGDCDSLMSVYHVLLMVIVEFLHVHGIKSDVLLSLFCKFTKFSFKLKLLSFDLQYRSIKYELSSSALEEYFGIFKVINDDNLKSFRSEGLNGRFVEYVSPDPHYLLLMFMDLVLECDSYLEFNGKTNQDLIDAVILFLNYVNGSPYITPAYLFVLLSRLWNCKSLQPSVTEYSRIFCKLEDHLCTIPSFDAPIDLSLLCFIFTEDEEEDEDVFTNAQSDNDTSTDSFTLTPEDFTQNSEVISGSTNIVEGSSDGQGNDVTADFQEGIELLYVYLSLFLGAELSGKVFSTFRLSVDTRSGDLKSCLISWLTLLGVYEGFKELGKLDYANAIFKLLTLKPSVIATLYYSNLNKLELISNQVKNTAECKHAQRTLTNTFGGFFKGLFSKTNQHVPFSPQEPSSPGSFPYLEEGNTPESATGSAISDAISRVSEINLAEGAFLREKTVLSGQSNTAIGGDLPIPYWWLEGDVYELCDCADESLLIVFLNLLIRCLQELLLKEPGYNEIVRLLYYKAVKIFPRDVSEVWNNCGNSYTKKQIKKFTKNEITPKLVKDEIKTIKLSNLDLQLTPDIDNRTINVKLKTKAEIPTKLSIKVPTTFPLEPLSFISDDDTNTFKNKYKRWIMIAQTEANRSGIAQGLYIWSHNVTKFFDGINECPICYSIVHAQFNTVPNKPCKVCKYKFHTECIYKYVTE